MISNDEVFETFVAKNNIFSEICEEIKLNWEFFQLESNNFKILIIIRLYFNLK